ncbi:hemin uptake protein HemP [Gymnodinialimonas ceratoperidinii]|uniref:Hemin uptake protein HemP n=2 Tax=Gymnodinialimonas ceratoperidinii TaxID=2856823 RepID=A0A8F6YEM6_9RHOB|nr:hemin uptake protein HemP [Gymnodinialimonas ceratoperidinii]QXT41377.1 hemin uptake protein HemP [Gymnodinialimonas ceratoperidinii]
MRPPSNPVYDAQRLVGDEGTAMIVLDDKTYTLRITRAGKLILTK